MNNRLYNFTRRAYRKAKRTFRKDPDRFLRGVEGVIHVGANIGQERKVYQHYGVKVVWIEPIPKLFEQLEENLREYSNQRALKALVTDEEGKEYEFHIANNNGLSSSIYDLEDHKDIWPQVEYSDSVVMRSTTLTNLLVKESIDPANYQALIMDAQGAELLILRGSIPILNNFIFIKTEVADFESYAGGCTLEQINNFMVEHGYGEYSRKIFAKREQGGNYYDIVYRKQG